MHDIKLVHILYARKYLLEKPTGLLLLKPLLRDDVVEEFAVGGVLGDEEELLLGFDNVVELDKMWMANASENVNFPRHSFDVGCLRHLPLLQDFDRHLVVGC